MESNKIGDGAAGALAAALRSEHSRLTSLDLRFNCLGLKAAAALATALPTDRCRLLRLDLRWNSLGADGAAALARAAVGGAAISMARWAFAVLHSAHARCQINAHARCRMKAHAQCQMKALGILMIEHQMLSHATI